MSGIRSRFRLKVLFLCPLVALRKWLTRRMQVDPLLQRASRPGYESQTALDLDVVVLLQAKRLSTVNRQTQELERPSSRLSTLQARLPRHDQRKKDLQKDPYVSSTSEIVVVVVCRRPLQIHTTYRYGSAGSSHAVLPTRARTLGGRDG
ncbi:hypothetical protein SCHPADRAFT_899157 [Schizopora paradoxa]|uniref:Secreted protein n=1 Tax=Schizopora paradoxa TaxID=27342 RepID=A0A0H2SPP9_9AGAM|nr:hypothetical protein SCHPADRAFT_899157 [Schizopora paradoxa]